MVNSFLLTPRDSILGGYLCVVKKREKGKGLTVRLSRGEWIADVAIVSLEISISNLEKATGLELVKKESQ